MAILAKRGSTTTTLAAVPTPSPRLSRSSSSPSRRSLTTGWDGNHIDRAIFRVIKEEASRRLALENGEVDWAMIGSVETFNALAENADLQTFSDPTLNELYFAFNQENEYLRDPKVREALS